MFQATIAIIHSQKYFIYFRVKMQGIKTSSTLQDDTYLFDADLHVLKEHLKSNQISQKMLDGHLLSGFQLVHSPGLATGFIAGIIRRLKPDKTGPDNTPKSGFYRLLLAFTIFLLFSSTKTVLIFYMFVK